VRRLRLMKSTHQAHSSITNPVNLRAVLTEFGGWQLALAGDLADGFFDFVHSDCLGGCNVGWRGVFWSGRG
jgi:hypothetical protein